MPSNAGRPPLPNEMKRQLLAARVLTKTANVVKIIKEKMPPSSEVVLNDKKGMASLGQVMDFLCDLAVEAGVLSDKYVFPNTSSESFETEKPVRTSARKRSSPRASTTNPPQKRRVLSKISRNKRMKS